MKRAYGVAAIVIAAFLAAMPGRLNAQNAVSVKADDIGGVVTGPHGPEAGVWVIAETHDFPTRYAKIVVTDDQGRYVVPDLPKAKYQVWVRGYGLIDSAKVDAELGKHVNLTAVPAPNDAAAAKYYPAIYWFAMLKIPGQDQFGGKSDIPDNVTQVDWLTAIEEPSLRRLPSARPASDADRSRGIGRVQERGRGLGTARAIRSGVAADGQCARRQIRRRAVQIFRRVDGQYRAMARCRLPSRSGRRASSVIS